jgi:hypothetical protein
MSNPYRGEVSITLGATEYIMRPTLGALCIIEDRLSKNLLVLFSNLMTLHEQVVIISETIKAADNNHIITEEEIAKAITTQGDVYILSKIIELFKRSLVS